MRRERDGAIEIGQRAHQVALGAPGIAAIVVGRRKIGVGAQRQIVVGDGAVEIALLEPDDAAIVERRHVLRVELDRLIVVGDGVVEVALAAKREAAIEIRRGIVRRQPDRLVVVGDGAVEVRLFVEGVAARHEGAGVVGVEPDRGVEIGDGAVKIVLRQSRAAAVGVGARIVGVERDRLREIGELRRRGRPSPASPRRGRDAGWRDWSADSGRNRSAPCRRRFAPRWWRAIARCSGAHPARLPAPVRSRQNASTAAKSSEAAQGEKQGENGRGITVSSAMERANVLSSVALLRLGCGQSYSAVHWPAKPRVTIYQSGRGHARNRRQPKSGPSKWRGGKGECSTRAVNVFTGCSRVARTS